MFAAVCLCGKCIPDVTCVAANKICDGLRATAKGALDAAGATIKGLGHTLDIAKGTLTAAQKATDATKIVLTEAAKSLSVVKGAMQGTVDIFNKITSFGLNGVFSIEEITFDAQLGNAALGKFSLSIRAKILGKTETLSVNADIHDIISTIVNPLAKKIGIKI